MIAESVNCSFLSTVLAAETSAGCQLHLMHQLLLFSEGLYLADGLIISVCGHLVCGPSRYTSG